VSFIQETLLKISSLNRVENNNSFIWLQQ